MDSSSALKPGGSGILPESTPSKFFARHLKAYYFVLPEVKGKNVLEIGFGDGYGSNFLAKHAKSVKAIDVLEKNVNLAKDKYSESNLEFIDMAATALKFEDRRFDCIVSFQVIEHIEEEELTTYLGEINRVLKKNGVAFISTLNLDKNKKPNKVYSKNPFHVKEFTYMEFEALIKEKFIKYEIFGLFYTKKLIFLERLKKSGLFKSMVNRFYNKIGVDDFVWKKEDLTNSIDFLAICRKNY